MYIFRRKSFVLLVFFGIIFTSFYLLSAPNVHTEQRPNDPPRDPVQIQAVEHSEPPRPDKWAYAFYAPNEAYLCYSLVNADRLFNSLRMKSNIDVILVVNSKSGTQKTCTSECFPDGRLKLFYTPDIGDEYDKSFGRFETFGMIDYTRIALVDSDGMIMNNLDHVFQVDLEGKSIASTIMAANGTEYLTTMIMVIQPSLALLERVSKFQSPAEVSKVLSEAENSDSPVLPYSSDADLLLNQMHKEKLVSVKKLPSTYTALESAFISNSSASNGAANAHFVSFDSRPLDTPDGGKSIDDNSVKDVLKASMDNSGSSPMGIFWQGYYKRCAGLMEE